MGALGSGRRYQSDEVSKVIENQISINILDLKKQGSLEPGKTSSMTFSRNGREIGWIFISAEEDMLSLDYHCNDHVRHQIIPIASTSPHYGGQRQYLLCPQCNSKREMLYYGPGGKFACRVCHGFVFRSQQLTPHMRHEQQAEKFANKLGGTDYIIDRKKPFRMQNNTFLKLQDKFINHRQKSCELFIEYVDNLFEKYGSVVGTAT